MLKRRKVLQAPKNDADSGLADCVWEQISRQRVQEPRRAQQTVDLGTHICSEVNGSRLHFRNERRAAINDGDQILQIVTSEEVALPAALGTLRAWWR